MTSIIVKISRGTEIRRFTDSQASLSWSTLSKRVKELFELDASTRIKCTYVDDEGDKVTLSSNSELAEAVGIALKSSPAVLRLAVVDEPTTTNKTMPTSDKGSAADVEMTDAATNSDAKSTADAGTHAKPTTADAETPATAPTPESVPESLAPLFATLAAQLPALVESLPPGVRNLIPHAELDIAATLAANATANASCAAAASGRAAQARAASNTVAGNTAAPPPANHAGTGVHLGVTCDKSGMSPIVGNRYNLVGHNYDVCQAEFDKLSEKEAELYVKIPPPFVHDMNGNGNTSAGNNHNGNNNNNHHGGAEPPQGVHPGVECDRSGVCPIVGMRYNLRGHNYDLCQAEFDKLPATEKLLYSAIPPPQQQQRGRCGPWGRGGWRNAMMGGVGGFPGGFPCAMGMGAGGTGMGMGGMGAGNGMGACPKLAARFVRDVTIFDGTQMAPSTSFTKIWRLKNAGEMPWPPGTRMLFVGGDQMTHEMSVPISHDGPVMPGEEVDVAVEMTAPADLGRYLGYWRLVGPHGRRKFGQRVWCHVQVVDPSQEAVATPPSDADLESTLAEIAKKKSDLAANEVDAHEDENDAEAQPLTTDGAGSSGVAAAGPSAEPSLAAVGAAEPTASNTQTNAQKAPAIDMSDGDAGAKDSDDDSLVDVDSEALAEAVADELAAAAEAATKEGTADKAVTASANPDPKTPAGVKALLGSMGFTDESLLEVVIQKHGADVEACARDLAAVSEWDNLLDDLAEMGFSNKVLNKTLMLKHSGNIKRTVKELVEDA